MASQQRRQRRAYELWLKKNNPSAYQEWKSKSHERGLQYQEEVADSVRKSEEAVYESLQTKMIQNLREQGKSNEEIDSYIEDWVQTIKVWGSKERPMRWHEVQKAKLKSND